MSYVLYFSPGTASLCVHQALIELDVPFSLERVVLDQGDQRQPAYLALNPVGRVPTLVIDGLAFHESASLLMTLADRHPERGLCPPPGSLARAAYHQWMMEIANNLQPAFRHWFYPQDLSADTHVQAAVRPAIQAAIEGVWQRIDLHLSASHPTGPWLLGEHYSMVDVLLTMLARWSRGMPKPATAWPAVGVYVGRLVMRQSWVRVVADEGLTPWPA